MFPKRGPFLESRIQASAHRAGEVHRLIEMRVLSIHFSSFQLSKNIIQWAEYIIVTSALHYSVFP